MHRKSGLARTHHLPAELFASTEYRKLVEVHASLLKQVGQTADQGHARRASRREATRSPSCAARSSTSPRQGVTLQRFKGLGEMNAEQLRVTTMAPESRTLMQVTIDDAAMAERTFSDLMGDKVEPRKEFITNNARDVDVLDV